MKEILRVRRRAFVKDEARRCSMHWWGGLHVSLTSFADSIASERIRKVVTDWVLDHSKTRKNFRVLPDYVTTTKVRKRVDAASVVFDASYFESLLDSVEKVDENFALAVSKRRKKLGRMRSMTILATNTRSEETHGMWRWGGWVRKSNLEAHDVSSRQWEGAERRSYVVFERLILSKHKCTQKHLQ